MSHTGFCGFQFAHYSEARLRFFRQLVADTNCPLAVYETSGQLNRSLTSIEESGLLDVEPLSAWLSSLPRPTGLFVCNDIRGQQVLNACRTLEIVVPDDMAEFTSLSRRQLERRFRAELHRTPHDEITAVQLQRVKQLLRETTMTLEDIAPLAGYSHKERLSAVFKRETGETPGEYRRSRANELP